MLIHQIPKEIPLETISPGNSTTSFQVAHVDDKLGSLLIRQLCHLTRHVALRVGIDGFHHLGPVLEG